MAPGTSPLKLGAYVADALRINTDQAHDLIDFGSIQINGRQERNGSRILKGGEEIRVYWPKYGTRRFYEISPERILYEDSYLLAYDKEAGIPSQQTPSDAYNNLFAAVERYLVKRTSVTTGGELGKKRASYVALLHRLDRETSGVMLFSIQRSVNRKLDAAWQNQKVNKWYLAWVEGLPAENEWMVDADIGRSKGGYGVCQPGCGKAARTAFRVLFRQKDRTLLLAKPFTGRTHQIRLHLSSCGFPVIGDLKYGSSRPGPLLLHGYVIQIEHPVTGELLTVHAPVPPHWPPESRMKSVQAILDAIPPDPRSSPD